MLIYAHGEVERFLDVGDRTFHIQHYAIGMPGSHGQAIRLGESDYRLVVLFRWAKSLRELAGCQPLMVSRAGRIIKVLKEAGEGLLVPWGQAKGEVQALGARQPAHRLQTSGCPRHVAVQ